MSGADDRFDPDLLEAFTVPEPSDDLGDRLFAQLARRKDRTASRPRRRRFLAAAAIAGFAVAATWLVVSIGRPRSQSGALTVAEQTTIELGFRTRAVAEPGTQIAWSTVDGGAVRVEQARGNVFYRVESGGGFVVETPGGTVSVRGTCFRVEIEEESGEMRIARQNIVAGAAGAALAAVAVVTVYEGKVLFANQHGQVELGAGDRAVASNDRAPRLAPEAAASLAPGSADGDATQLTVAELLERDRVQLARIAKLEAELEQFRDQAGARGQADTEAPPKPPCELTKDELVELARVCNLPFDMPPTAGSSIMDEILEEGFDKAHFTEAERAAVDRVITQFQPGYETSLRSLYRELTGESGEALDVTTLMFEIVQKSPRADIAAAKQVVARERAGLQAPPPNSNAGTVIERFFRLALRAGEDFEAALAELVPPDRAREFRRNWGEVRPGAGCPE